MGMSHFYRRQRKMCRTSKLIFLILNTIFSAMCFEIFKVKDECALNRNFWVVHEKFLELSDTIFLTNLYYHAEKHEKIEEFATKIITFLNAAVTINNHFLRNNNMKQSTRFYVDSYINEQPLRKIKSISNRDIKKMRHLSSDTENATIVIGDLESVELYLQNESIVPNPRAIYVIFLIDDNIEDTYVGSILERFWKQLHVLNVIIHGPCSSEAEYIYIYSPFYLREENIFGATEKYNIKDVLLNQSLIMHSLDNLNGYKLNVTMFVRIPTAFRRKLEFIKPEDMQISGGYYGLDGSFVSALAKKMNFSVSLFEPMDGNNFGDVLENGQISGSLADVVYGRADLAGNSRFLIDYGTGDIEFTTTIYSEQICAIVPKALRIPQAVAIFKCFTVSSWLAIFSIFVLTMCFRYFFHCITSNSFTVSDSNIFFDVYGVLLGVSINLRHVQNHYFFFSSCMIFNIIIIGLFEGNLMKYSSIASYYKDINSLSELVNADLPVVTSLSVLDKDDSEQIRQLYLKKKPVVNDETLEYLCKYRNISTLGRKTDTLFFKNYYFTGKNGEPYLHIVEDCLMNYFVGYIVPKGSTYLNKIDDVLSHLMEGGFIGKWYKDVVDFVEMQKMFGIDYDFDTQEPFNLNDVQAAFFLLIFGLLLAGNVFIFEILRIC